MAPPRRQPARAQADTGGPPEIGKVRIHAADPPLTVVAWLGDERPDMQSGYGGWDEITRPRRAPITTWRSAPGMHLSLPILLDGYADGNSVEDEIDRLERMGQPLGANAEPPQLKISAKGGAVPHQDLPWVLADMAFGDALMNERGNRVRQAVTLTLYEYIEDVRLGAKSASVRVRAAAAAAKPKRGAKEKRVVVKAGETLTSIAARALGDANRWREIAQLNNIRDPQNVKVGQVVRMP